MNVTLTTPNRELLRGSFSKISAEGTHGSFCILDRHTDFLALLAPGIVTLSAPTGYRILATDSGVLVKRGPDVFIATQQAMEGDSLPHLRETVASRFKQLDAAERASVAAVARLEANFVRRLLDIQEGPLL